MKRETIKETFKRLVAEGVEGFILTPEGEEHKPNSGYAVACKTYDTLDEALDNVGEYQFIGFWVHPETKQAFIEVVDILEYKMAAFFYALAARQSAFYDFANDSVVNISGLNSAEEEGQQACQDGTA